MDQFAINSGMFQYFKSNLFGLVVKNSNLPKGFPFPLHTDVWGLLLPTLKATYPHMDMEIMLTMANAPSVNMAAGAATFDASFFVDVLVLPPGKKPQSAFTIEAVVNATVAIDCFQSAKGPAIGLQIGSATGIHMSLVKSTIGACACAYRVLWWLLWWWWFLRFVGSLSA
jgi:hypothetical protein